MTTKLIQAIPGMPEPVIEIEVDTLLESKSNMQLATLDEGSYPSIHPVWFCRDTGSRVIGTGTQNGTKTVGNIGSMPDKIYFSINDGNFPYNGANGRGVASLSEEKEKNISIMEKINLMYICTLEHLLARMLMENARNRTEVVVEILLCMGFWKDTMINSIHSNLAIYVQLLSTNSKQPNLQVIELIVV